MIISGLTGGIATGKSTISAILKECGAIIIDADLIAHAVVKKGLEAYERIAAHFGTQILLPDGEINRPRLGNIVFNHPDEKEMLNQIVHPFVFEEMERQIREFERKNPASVVISDIPLLIESGMHKNFSEIILVYIPEYLQIQRLMIRDDLCATQANTRIRAQMPIEEKKRFATMIIDNSDSLENTRNQTIAVYQQLRR
ncbi:MAG: dephospho-CoA kinase [Desulfobacteraceae bacterium IS3]|nr:MAG: dephospho-CoA kinase [Desulfobacteraceae bacterium IS3]